VAHWFLSATGKMAKITLAEIDLSGVELRPSATWRVLSQVRMRVVSDNRIPVDCRPLGVHLYPVCD
jgi:hypothetical protein